MPVFGGDCHEKNNSNKIQNACSSVLERKAANGFLLRRIRVANVCSSKCGSISIENVGSESSASAARDSVEVVDGEAACFAATVGSRRASSECARRAVLPTEFCAGKESESDETVMDQSNKRMRKPGSRIELPGTYHHSSTDRGNDLRSRARIRLVGSKLAVKVDLIGVSETGLGPFFVLRTASDD